MNLGVFIISDGGVHTSEQMIAERKLQPDAKTQADQGNIVGEGVLRTIVERIKAVELGIHRANPAIKQRIVHQRPT
nr:hypothetical protein [Methylomarinum sp. Ch1-1]MDP4519609.1 hypothetical protein [Methylomarinum sp. Ch1-1]